MVVQRFITRASCLLIKSQNLKQISNFHKSRLIHTTRWNLADRFYTDKHEWVQVVDKIGIVGISQYAQEALGDVVYAQLPDVGTVLNQNDECGALESVKAASEIYSPVSGKVIEKNTAVEDSPSLINTSCYDKGWLFKVELSNSDAVKDLMSETKYQEYLKSQDH